MTKGRCCCSYPNEVGAKRIHIIDMIFLPNFPRWIFAVWAKVDDERMQIYLRMRQLSFWLFWALLMGLVIGTSLQTLS